MKRRRQFAWPYMREASRRGQWLRWPPLCLDGQEVFIGSRIDCAGTWRRRWDWTQNWCALLEKRSTELVYAPEKRDNHKVIRTTRLQQHPDLLALLVTPRPVSVYPCREILRRKRQYACTLPQAEALVCSGSGWFFRWCALGGGTCPLWSALVGARRDDFVEGVGLTTRQRLRGSGGPGEKRWSTVNVDRQVVSQEMGNAFIESTSPH